MNLKEKLIPKKYWDRVDSVEEWGDLIDDCKYMLTMADGWLVFDEYPIAPIKNIKELKEVVKNAIKENE